MDREQFKKKYPTLAKLRYVNGFGGLLVIVLLIIVILIVNFLPTISYITVSSWLIFIGVFSIFSVILQFKYSKQATKEFIKMNRTIQKGSRSKFVKNVLGINTLLGRMNLTRVRVFNQITTLVLGVLALSIGILALIYFI